MSTASRQNRNIRQCDVPARATSFVATSGALSTHDWDRTANAPVEDAFPASYQYRLFWVATFFFLSSQFFGVVVCVLLTGDRRGSCGPRRERGTPLGILAHWVQVMRSTGTLGRRWLKGDKGFVDWRMCLLSETLTHIPGCHCPFLFLFFTPVGV